MKPDQCEASFDLALASTNEAELCRRIAPLFDVYQILSVGIGRGSNTFWRARLIDEQRWPRLKGMDYPPPGKASAGRLNEAVRLAST